MFLTSFFTILLIFGLYFNNVNTTKIIRKNSEDENSKIFLCYFIFIFRESRARSNDDKFFHIFEMEKIMRDFFFVGEI